MNLNDDQRQEVRAWVQEGLKLSEIQKRLESRFGLRLTYMEVRFLMDDLKVMPKDPAPAPAPPPVPPAPAGAGPATRPGDDSADDSTEQSGALPGTGSVQVGLDRLARPGAMISGSVTFSDGQSGQWFIDEMGQLGLAMKQKGYRPPAADIEEFQLKLQQLLARQGY